MALIHFAFGNLAGQGKYTEQADAFCEKILGHRRLKASLCPEFLPILNNLNAQWAIPDSAQATQNGGVEFQEWTNSPPVSLLPQNIWMLCFTDLSLSKLSQWPHTKHYGKLAIVFTNDFRARVNARQVSYYQLHNLSKDPKVIAYNQAIKKNHKVEELANELLAYRKPAKLWPEFRKLFGVTALHHGPNGITINPMPYSRYEDGYVFSTEAEARVLATPINPYIQFDESDVFQILAPSLHAQHQIQSFLKENWVKKPPVFLFPT
jgi:hypothetical protein